MAGGGWLSRDIGASASVLSADKRIGGQRRCSLCAKGREEEDGRGG
jgi:hypothetical protein